MRIWRAELSRVFILSWVLALVLPAFSACGLADKPDIPPLEEIDQETAIRLSQEYCTQGHLQAVQNPKIISSERTTLQGALKRLNKANNTGLAETTRVWMVQLSGTWEVQPPPADDETSEPSSDLSLRKCTVILDAEEGELILVVGMP